MNFSEPIKFSAVAAINADALNCHLAKEIRAGVLSNGAVYLRTTEPLSKEVFRRLSQGLGTPLCSDAPAPALEIGPFAHRVEVAENGTVIDKFGRIPLSSTSKEIDFHTEDFFEENPSDVILFRCVRQATEGGLTRLSFLKEIVQLLDADTVALLSDHAFPTYSFPKPILSGIAGQTKISFNPHVIARARSEGATLDEKYVRAVELLLEAAEISSITMRLLPNDILVIDNKVVLHSRTEFPSDSDRLIYRTKVAV